MAYLRQQVIEGLENSLESVFTARLHFYEQLAGVKAVDAPSPAAQLLHALLEADQALVRKAEHVAQAAYEVLSVTHFVAGIGIAFDEAVGAVKDLGFVEGDGHIPKI